MTALWIDAGGSTGTTDVSGVGPVADPVIAGAVGEAESGGDATIQNSILASGLWQIHPPQDGWEDPAKNAAMAVAKWKAAHGWTPWEAFTGADGRGDDGPWRTYLGQGGGAGTSGAAPCGGGGGVPGKVEIAAGANLPGRPVTPETLAFLATVAGLYGHAIVCTTGTNHSEFTVDGNVSDHFDGHACDLGMVANHGTDDGPVGDAIATACLTAAGDPLALASREARAGGLWTRVHDGLRIQCIWKTDAGGNHHNHVHIGSRSAT